jgi:hypothetical protein
VKIFRRALSRLRPFGTLVKVLALLAVFDLGVRGPFFDFSIMPYNVTRFPMLRDRTIGRGFSILFEALDRIPRPDARVVIVGDSTVFATEGLDDRSSLAYLLRSELRHRFPRASVEVVDASQIALYASDAALLINRALEHDDIDVVVYAVTLRALPSEVFGFKPTHISSELGPTDLARLTAAGGAPWMLQTVSGPELLNGLVYSTWKTYAYRAELKNYFWGRAVRPAIARWPAVVQAIRPGPLYPPMDIAPPPADIPRRVYPWSRDRYRFPNDNTEALETIGRVCQSYAPGRCFLYAGPLNPLARGDYVEPGLYEEFMAQLRVIVGRYSLGWRDYTTTMNVGDFRHPMFHERYDAIHLNVAGGRKLASRIADAVQDQVAAAIRKHRTIAFAPRR